MMSSRVSRRKFLAQSACAALAGVLPTGSLFPAPEVLTASRTTPAPKAQGELLFLPHFVQRGRGPHLLEWAFATSADGDVFHSNIRCTTKNGLTISDTEGQDRFAVDVRWNIEGFGYLFLTADNAGEFYELPEEGSSRILNLNYELAKSRAARNRARKKLHERGGVKLSPDLRAYLDVAEGYLDDARKKEREPARCAELSQRSLSHSLQASEMLECEAAEDRIRRAGARARFFVGCDARAFYDMNQDLFLERFAELFNYATITYVWKGGLLNDFEAKESEYQFEARDLLLRRLHARAITVEGRPLFWFHKWVTPDWLKKKSYDGLKRYIEKRARDLAAHYGQELYAWEVMNEFHDWANELELSPEQTVELTKFACDTVKDAAPGVKRLINNCSPFAEYVQMGEYSGGKAKYPQRTPWKFTKDLIDAGVEFDLVGQQMYFPVRDLQDIVMNLERLMSLGKTIQLSEIGAPGGPTERSVKLGTVGFPKEPYAWHRPWDQELQAEWLERIFTIAYSYPQIEAANWFDFLDPVAYIDNGGLLASAEGEVKPAYERLRRLQERWKQLPIKQ